MNSLSISRVSEINYHQQILALFSWLNFRSEVRQVSSVWQFSWVSSSRGTGWEWVVAVTIRRGHETSTKINTRKMIDFIFTKHLLCMTLNVFLQISFFLVITLNYKKKMKQTMKLSANASYCIYFKNCAILQK